ncbi:hypothetical protein GobsT_61990 [Gemmata obscuriglobus]|uniref:Uncharacterized protein n=1 Tax=Gemmata obscuriglobus TaxID=114 RepID=A0A2Z3GX22_9BACT|nr:hypothetical protein [Gemmata obscuriglobus]AWM36047.1 hypothetical protein C1280_02835 [Gemmata obscuriglobus]QEG31378.1 hypothetical protein GobsT_61990 [Gemmata obscuriglobus]VTS10718.1 unnamed protein product [Gemmata obscuriglobus UQM 2246]
MELPVLVSPQQVGFRASAGSPFDLTADGSTPDEAVDALRSLIAARLHSGQVRAVTVTDATAVVDAARKVGESPLFEDWAREVEEYRRQNNTVPAAG